MLAESDARWSRKRDTGDTHRGGVGGWRVLWRGAVKEETRRTRRTRRLWKWKKEEIISGFNKVVAERPSNLQEGGCCGRTFGQMTMAEETGGRGRGEERRWWVEEEEEEDEDVDGDENGERIWWR